MWHRYEAMNVFAAVDHVHVHDILTWDVVQKTLLWHQVLPTRQHHGSWHQFPLEWHQSSVSLHCGGIKKNHRIICCKVQPISWGNHQIAARFRARWAILKAWSCWKLIPCSTSCSIDANEAPRKRHWPNGLYYKWKQIQHCNGMSKTCSWGASLHSFLRPWSCETSTDIFGYHWWNWIGMLRLIGFLGILVVVI